MKRNLLQNRGGSILIWTVLLGVMMASSFLFVATRLRSNAQLQQKTIQYQSEKAFISSYLAYLKTLDATELDALKTSGIAFDGITGTVTNEATEITGVLDAGQEAIYPINGQIKVEWNLCDEAENGTMELTPASAWAGGSCVLGGDYDHISTPNPVGTLTLKSTLIPFHYRITPIGATVLTDSQWTARLSVDLDYLKEIEVQGAFSAAP